MTISDAKLEHWREYAKRDDCRFVPSDIRCLVGDLMRAREKLGECHAGYETLRKELADEQAAHAETRQELAYITKLCRSEQKQLAKTTENLSDSERDLAAAQGERDEAREALEWRSPETAPAWTTVLIACQSQDLQFATVARRNEDTGVWEDDEGDEYSNVIGWKPIVMPNGFTHGGSPARAALGKRGEG